MALLNSSNCLTNDAISKFIKHVGQELPSSKYGMPSSSKDKNMENETSFHQEFRNKEISLHKEEMSLFKKEMINNIYQKSESDERIKIFNKNSHIEKKIKSEKTLELYKVLNEDYDGEIKILDMNSIDILYSNINNGLFLRDIYQDLLKTTKIDYIRTTFSINILDLIHFPNEKINDLYMMIQLKRNQRLKNLKNDIIFKYPELFYRRDLIKKYKDALNVLKKDNKEWKIKDKKDKNNEKNKKR